ncbi:hypothetical protein ACP4OV_030497 [Aristida adscensionis]
MAPRPSPYEKMLRSTAYGRMRAAHPPEFEPASVFFTHDPRGAIDRRNSFRVKAALVYKAVTGHHVDDHRMPVANQLLLALATACHSKLHTPAADDAYTAVCPSRRRNKVVAEGGDAAPLKGKPELTDDAMDDEHKRVVDAIFLAVGFLPRLMEAIDKCAGRREDVDESFRSRNMQDIVTDVIKLENQLPLADLLDVTGVVEGVINDTVADEAFKKSITAAGEYKLPFTRRTSAPRRARRRRRREAIPHAGGERAPAVGVRLEAGESGRAEVEFREQWAALRLPALVYDFKLATVARNLLARESLADEQSKPVTRYFQMMNELVEDVADVRFLRRAGAVRGGSGGAQEVHALIKDIDGHATYPSVYMAMDREIDKVRQLHEKRMKSFFVRNRPRVYWASSVAAISVMAIVAARRNRG